MSRKQQKEKEVANTDKKKKFVITAKEMEQIEDLKKTLSQ